MFPPLPSSWSTLSWQQLCDVWRVKQRYGGQPDIAVCAALLQLLHLTVDCRKGTDGNGMDVYLLADNDGNRYSATPLQLAYTAHQALPWFDYPYGDPGQEEKKDDKGNITQQHRDAHPGYVGPLRDAMMLPIETVTVRRKVFALPQVACNNLTWQQYRSLQAITPQLWKDDNDDATTLSLMAQFMAHILVPRSLALLDKSGDTIRLRPHHTFQYNNEQADRLVTFWQRRLQRGGTRITTLFHICHQVWQTALGYYSKAFPQLFSDGDNHGPMRDALQGEVGTVNTIMKYAGYAEQQQVYDSNLPFVLDILNTMTKEAKEIEAMNRKARKK